MICICGMHIQFTIKQTIRLKRHTKMDLTHSVTQSWPRERSFLPEKKRTSINPSVVINTGDSLLVTTSHMSHNYRVMLYVSILKQGKTSFWQWVCLPYNCIYIYWFVISPFISSEERQFFITLCTRGHAFVSLPWNTAGCKD